MRKSNLLIALACAVSAACSSTKYAEYDSTGNKILEFKTSANIGFTTDKVAESNASSGGIPFLNGNNANDTLTETGENEEPATIVVGQLTINGTLDHSTTADTSGHWFWRISESVGKIAIFWKGFDIWGASNSNSP